jgi:hypothetical protein
MKKYKKDSSLALRFTAGALRNDNIALSNNSRHRLTVQIIMYRVTGSKRTSCRRQKVLNLCNGGWATEFIYSLQCHPEMAPQNFCGKMWE